MSTKKREAYEHDKNASFNVIKKKIISISVKFITWYIFIEIVGNQNLYRNEDDL